MAKSALSNHNEMLLSLFGGLITASCTELLFNLVSLCYDYEHNIKHFPAEAWNRDEMMYCFFKRCYDDEE